MTGTISSTTLTDIADAIRQRNGLSDTYTPSQMPQAILDLPGPEPEYKHVTFIDYDGEMVATYTLEEALELSESPVPPSHLEDELPLVFQGYNWTLQEIKSQLTAHPELPIIAGALYCSDDDKTHILCTIPKSAQEIVAYMSYPGSIDWGDERETTAVEGQTFYNHAYNFPGNYHIVIDSENVGFYGNGRSVSPRKISISRNSQLINGFRNCYKLNGIPLPKGVILPESLQWDELEELKAFVVPNATTYNIQTFPNLTGLKVLSTPPDYTPPSLHLDNLISLEHFAFSYNYSPIVSGLYSTELTDIVIPGSQSNIGAFYTNSQTKWKRLYIGEGSTRVGANMGLQRCSCLKEIHFPSTMVFIGYLNFYPEATIYCLAQTPPELFATYSLPSKIYIPYGTTSVYESTTGWSDFAGVYEELPQTP